MAGKETRDAQGYTSLERRFVLRYLESFNATQAYIAASTRKVTNRTAEVNGYRLLQRPEIQELVRAERDRLMGKAELSVEATLEKLRQLLMYDVRKLYDIDGNPRRLSELDDDMAAAIVGIKVVTRGNAEMGLGEVTEFKLADKVGVLEKALKYHGLFERDNRQRTDPVTELLNAVYGQGSRLTPSA